MRVSKYALPCAPTKCVVGGYCVYRDEQGVCDEPRINKGNGDAKCHRMGNAELLKYLGEKN